MIKSVIERMTHYYYGKSHIKQVSFDELKKAVSDYREYSKNPDMWIEEE